MNQYLELTDGEADPRRLSSVVSPQQQIELGQMLSELARSLTEGEPDPGKKPWRRRLRTVFTGVSEVLGQLLQDTGQLRVQAPDNWPTSLAYVNLQTVIKDGFPVLWVPNGETLMAMAHATDRRARQQVLLDARDQLLAEAKLALARVTALDLAADRALVEQALACVVEQPGPAQAAALLVATTRAQAETGSVSLSKLYQAGVRASKRDLLAAVKDLRGTLMLTALAPALEHFYPNTGMPVPGRPNRHAVAHVTSDVQYTPGNALESVLLAVSVLRQAQASRDAASKPLLAAPPAHRVPWVRPARQPGPFHSLGRPPRGSPLGAGAPSCG